MACCTWSTASTKTSRRWSETNSEQVEEDHRLIKWEGMDPEPLGGDTSSEW